MTYLLDTNTCIFWLKNVGNVRERVNSHEVDEVTTSVISVGELFYGVANSSDEHRKHNLEKLQEFVSEIGYLGYSSVAAKHFGEEKAKLRRIGQLIADLDLLIAAIALDESAILVTDNLKHFERIPSLKSENWK